MMLRCRAPAIQMAENPSGCRSGSYVVVEPHTLCESQVIGHPPLTEQLWPSSGIHVRGRKAQGQHVKG